MIEWIEADDGRSWHTDPAQTGVMLTIKYVGALSVRQYQVRAWGYHSTIRPVFDREQEFIAGRSSIEEAKEVAEEWYNEATTQGAAS